MLKGVQYFCVWLVVNTSKQKQKNKQTKKTNNFHIGSLCLSVFFPLPSFPSCLPLKHVKKNYLLHFLNSLIDSDSLDIRWNSVHYRVKRFAPCVKQNHPKPTYHFKAASRTKTNEEAHWKLISKINWTACELVNFHLVFALSRAHREGRVESLALVAEFCARSRVEFCACSRVKFCTHSLVSSAPVVALSSAPVVTLSSAPVVALSSAHVLHP